MRHLFRSLLPASLLHALPPVALAALVSGALAGLHALDWRGAILAGAAAGLVLAVAGHPVRVRTYNASRPDSRGAPPRDAQARFLAAASHDLRQPMQALGLFVEELAAKPHPPDQRRLVSQIGAATEALQGLVDSLLDLSRLEAGATVPRRRPVALRPVFDRLRDAYARRAREAGLRYRVNDTTAWVETDPVLLDRILHNLVSNALRYTPHGGTVLVAVRRRSGGLAIEVRDNGIGIDAAYQDSVFDEFVQLGNPERDRRKGLGLGLAIVRRAAELLGHPVTLRSAPGRGSVFALLLPQTSAASPEGDACCETLLIDFTGLTFAVVDDDSATREALTRTLEAWGCHVVAGAGPDAVLDACEGHPPDALIADWHLPGAGGDGAVVQRFRARFGASLPALAVNGDLTQEARHGAHAAGVPVLAKPVRAAPLRAALRRLLAAPPDAADTWRQVGYDRRRADEVEQGGDDEHGKRREGSVGVHEEPVGSDGFCPARHGDADAGRR